MIASFGMYDPPWLHDANDHLWRAIAARLRTAGLTAVPAGLTRTRALGTIWTAPDLLLAQTCGYPLTMHLADAVTLVATPCYNAPGCEGAAHRSALIVRRDDPAPDLAALAGRRAAINARDSNSGMNLLRAAIAPYARGGRFFGRVIETGTHQRSLNAVIAGAADIAAIDAVTLALLRDRYRGIDRRVRVLGWTTATPGLPLVTAAGQPPATVRALRIALADVLTDPALAGTRAALRLTGFATLGRADYAVIPALEASARAAGYPAVA